MKYQHITVLQVTTSFPQNEGDPSGIFVWRLIKHLEMKDVQLRVLCPSGIKPTNWPKNIAVARFRYGPFSWQRLANRNGGIPQTLRKNPFLYFLVPFFLISMGLHTITLARHCDLIHAHWSICGAIAILTRPFHRKPVITTLRGTDMDWGEVSGPYRWLHKVCINKSFFAVGVSEEIVSKLREAYPRLRGRFVFIPNGVSEKFYGGADSSKRSFSDFRMLFVGNLVPEKGVDVIIQAMALSKHSKSVRLTIAGDGPDRGRLQLLAMKYGLEENIEFLGNVPPEHVPNLMSSHHVLGLLSVSEGRPNVVLEAMATGLPVVGADIKGIRELVQDGQTGWIVPKGDCRFLAKVIDDMRTGSKDWAAAGRAGRKWMTEKGLSWERSSSQYRELYSRVLKTIDEHRVPLRCAV